MCQTFSDLSWVIDLIINPQSENWNVVGNETKKFFLNLPQITQNDDCTNDHSRYFIHIDHFGNIIFIILILFLSIYKSRHCTPSFCLSAVEVFMPIYAHSILNLFFYFFSVSALFNLTSWYQVLLSVLFINSFSFLFFILFWVKILFSTC